MQAFILQGIHPNMTKDYSPQECQQFVHLQVALNDYFQNENLFTLSL
jgi:hypothetical protein